MIGICVSTGRRGTWLAIVMIALCSLAGACGTNSPARASASTAKIGVRRHTAISFDPTDRTKPKLAISGDSITVLATHALVDEFRPNFNISIHARIGISTGGMSSGIAEDARERPDVEIISLGTNDVRCTDARGCGVGFYRIPQFNAATVETRLDSFAAEFPATTCVVFVTINTHNPSWNPAGARKLNTYLRTKSHVLDWDAMWKSGYFDEADSPHPNAVGNEVLAKALRHTVDGCPKHEFAPRPG